MELLHFAHRYRSKCRQERIYEKNAEQDVSHRLTNLGLASILVFILIIATNYDSQNSYNCEGYHQDFKPFDFLFQNEERHKHSDRRAQVINDGDHGEGKKFCDGVVDDIRDGTL